MPEPIRLGIGEGSQRLSKYIKSQAAGPLSITIEIIAPSNRGDWVSARLPVTAAGACMASKSLQSDQSVDFSRSGRRHWAMSPRAAKPIELDATVSPASTSGYRCLWSDQHRAMRARSSQARSAAATLVEGYRFGQPLGISASAGAGGYRFRYSVPQGRLIFSGGRLL